MNALKILSGGAAQGFVETLAPIFAARTGWRIDGDFGAVGTMAAKLRAGANADLVILTEAIVGALDGDGFVVPRSAAPIGLVETAVAVRESDPIVKIGGPESLRAALLASDAFFVPDMQSSTAGQHVAVVLDQLGIAEKMRARLHESPNGATAMQKLSESEFVRPLGCTQSTEIIRTPGLTLVGPLPPPYALATVYVAAVTSRASDPAMAQMLIDILTAPDNSSIRERTGFLAIA